jgi:hypothetical protein
MIRKNWKKFLGFVLSFNETVNSGFLLVVQPDLLNTFCPSVDYVDLVIIDYHNSDDNLFNGSCLLIDIFCFRLLSCTEKKEKKEI